MHLDDVHMNYIEHFMFSMRLCCVFAVASAKACLHAVFPEWYTNSSSQAIGTVARMILNDVGRRPSELRINDSIPFR